MPNAKCDFCGKWLEDILLKHEHKLTLVRLVKERKKHVFGPIFKIEPGIGHKEVNTESICPGILYYYPLAPTPDKLKKFDMCDAFGNGDVDNLLKMLEENPEEYS